MLSVPCLLFLFWAITLTLHVLWPHGLPTVHKLTQIFTAPWTFALAIPLLGLQFWFQRVCRPLEEVSSDLSSRSSPELILFNITPF